MGDRKAPVVATIHSFTTLFEGNEPDEGYTLDRITVDADGCEWRIAPAHADGIAEVAESKARAVNWFMRDVMAKKQRAIRRGIVRAAPKPTRGKSKSRTITQIDAIPCPRCDGDALPGCRLCDGRGTVTAVEAAAWEEEHG